MVSVKDFMTRNVVTVRSDTPFKEIVDLLMEHGIGGLPVVDGDKLVGIVTETDLLTKPALAEEGRPVLSFLGALLGQRSHGWHKKASGMTAGELMTRHVITAGPLDAVDAVARRLVHRNIGRLPVVDHGRLVGIISRRDLLRPFRRADAEIAKDVASVLHDRMMFEYDHHVQHVVDNGVVTLTGTIMFPHDVDTVDRVVRHLPGVVDVRNGVTAELPEGAITPSHGLRGDDHGAGFSEVAD